MKRHENNTNENDTVTWKVMQECLPGEALSEYQKTFNLFDPDRTGLIRTKDVGDVLKSIGRNISVQDIEELLREMVGNSVGKASFSFVDFREFIAIMSIIITSYIPEDEMYLVFRQFDSDGDGYISPHELRDLLSRLGDEITDEDLKDMMREADQDGDGRVSYKEFVRVMTNSIDSYSASLSVVRPANANEYKRRSAKGRKSERSYAGASEKQKLSGGESETDEEDFCLSRDTSDNESFTDDESKSLRKSRRSWLPAISLRRKRTSVDSSTATSSDETLSRESSISRGSVTRSSSKKSFKRRLNISGRAALLRVAFRKGSKKVRDTL